MKLTLLSLFKDYRYIISLVIILQDSLVESGVQLYVYLSYEVN